MFPLEAFTKREKIHFVNFFCDFMDFLFYKIT
ncbi:hypothetical protein LSS_19448 [Leptospira santarosai serovar Shermani str. LT 821]|uniref:Uncharacterized protein n=1 Tax=Leptospira santarosai serovar Shermani str. LT 821 TaxID=758847 RepID=K8Y2Z9_9LEPT|nr:hypothetical protein LSS_19448 [Leptospira santarosai serovar Shermani str. LT 821]